MKPLLLFRRITTPVDRLIADISINPIQILESKIRSRESFCESVLDSALPYVVRLDGIHFKNLTSKMKKPFDDWFTKSMESTAVYLFQTFAPRTVFVQSDEINLVFPTAPPNGTHLFSGRTQKISTTCAAQASVFFQQHILSHSWSEATLDDIRLKGCFDARAFSVDDETTGMEAVYWRHKYDLRRNMINSIGQHILGTKKIHCLSISQIIQYLKLEHNVNVFKDFNPSHVYGKFYKKEQAKFIYTDKKTGVSTETSRSFISGRSFDWLGTEEERTKMIFSKYWLENDPKDLGQEGRDKDETSATVCEPK